MKRLILLFCMLVWFGLPIMADPPIGENQFLLWASGNYVDGICQDEACAYMLWEYNPVNFKLEKVIVDNGFNYDIALEVNFSNGEDFIGAWKPGHYELIITGNADRFVNITPYPDGSIEIEFVGVDRIAVISPCNDCSNYAGNVFNLPPGQR